MTSAGSSGRAMPRRRTAIDAAKDAEARSIVHASRACAEAGLVLVDRTSMEDKVDAHVHDAAPDGAGVQAVHLKVQCKHTNCPGGAGAPRWRSNDGTARRLGTQLS